MAHPKQLPPPNNITPISTGYMPPSSPEAEQSVLGAVLVRPELFDVVATLITPTDFYRQAHGDIFQAMLDLREAEKPVDLVTVSALLKERGKIEGVGGPGFIAGLSEQCGHSTNAEYYAGLVRDKARLRRLLDTTQEIAAACFAPVENVSEFLSESAQKVSEVSETAGDLAAVTLETMVDRQSTVVEAQYYAKEPGGLPVGYLDLARLISWEPGDLIVLAARPSMGKAQPLDAKIKTWNGWKPLKEVQFGEKLASVDGMESRVIGIYPQGMKSVYRITFSDGRSTECCKEHLWRIHYRKWQLPKILSTVAVIALLEQPQYQNRLYIDLPNGEFGHKEKLPVEPWLLGVFLGNGNLTGSALRFSTPDAETIIRVNDRIGSGMAVNYAGAYDYRIVTDGGCNREGVMGVVPNALKESLKGLGLWGLSSTEKFIPDIYLNAPRVERLELIRGLIDTDGWVEKTGTVRFSTSSRRLAGNMVSLIRSIGGLCQISEKQPAYTYKGEKKVGVDHYVCRIRYHSPDELMYLHRKKMRASCGDRVPRLTIKSIELSRQADSACIMVSHPSHLYLTDDFIATHNTALALNFMLRVAAGGAHAGIFTLETSKEKLTRRFMSILGRINGHRMNQGNLAPQEWVQFSRLRDQVEGMPIWIDDADLNIAEMRARARRQRKAGQLDFLVVDYLQLVKPMRRGRSREEDVAELSRGLKKLAKELEIPILAVSALNRKFADRPNKRPMRSDLRESGAIEFDADKILFLYREEEDKPNLPEAQGIAEVDVDKHKDGPTGLVKLAFQKEFFRFEDLADG